MADKAELNKKRLRKPSASEEDGIIDEIEEELKKECEENPIDETKIKPKNPKGFRLNSKSVLLTYAQCDKPKEWLMEFLKKLGMVVIVVSKEDHHETEGKHLHAYGEWNRKVDIRNAKHFDLDGFHPNIGKDKSFGKKSAKSSKHDMIKYVTKDGDYIEFGIECKKYLECVKDKRAYICSKLINGDMTLVQAVEEDSKLLLTLSSLQKNLSLFQTLKAESEYKGIRKCWWIYGKPGIGKSYAVRSLYPNLYVKSSTKWWDGYTNQDVVLIDDLDSDALKHYIKIWADPYKFVGETKGGSITPCYSKLFITSNYTIDELYKEEKMCSAIERRFEIINADISLDLNGHFNLKIKF